MKDNIRSEYIKNLFEDKEVLSNKLEEVTKNTLQNVVDEAIGKQLRDIISESDDDDFEVEEVTPEDSEATDTEDSNDSVETDTEIDDVDGVESDTTDAEGGEDDTTGEEMWDDLEQYKTEDGEYDLTGMDKDSAIKVLKVMDPEKDGVRVMKNDNGTFTLQDDETEKEYIIDIDDSFETESGNEEDEFDIELETDECDMKDGYAVNEGEVDLGYTDDYQDRTAMTTPSNHEPASKKDTYSMDAGVPTGTEKPWVGHKGDMSPYDEPVNETMTSTENSANTRGTGMTHANTNNSHKFARNGHVGGKETRGTGEGYEPATNESILRIKKKANDIYRENKQLRQVAESIKTKLEEAIVINASLGNIIKLITENSTTLTEKQDIIKRYNNVKTINEGKALYSVISDELKKAGKFNNTGENTLNNQLAESKKMQVVEKTMYQSSDLSATLDLMERLNKI